MGGGRGEEEGGGGGGNRCAPRFSSPPDPAALDYLLIRAYAQWCCAGPGLPWPSPSMSFASRPPVATELPPSPRSVSPFVSRSPHPPSSGHYEGWPEEEVS